MADAIFTQCMRPDCTGHPRYCSAACAQAMEGPVQTVAMLEDALTAANVNLASAIKLLRKAGAALTEREMGGDQPDQRLLPEIGAFIARMP